jgi:mandelate racemase
MDWADALVQEPLRIVDGHAIIPERPGNGLVWDQAKVARFRM